MSRGMRRLALFSLLLVVAGLLAGCRGRSKLAMLQDALDECERDREAALLRPPGSDYIEGIRVTPVEGGVRIDVPGDFLFAAGKATLKSQARQKLANIARGISSKYPGHLIRVDGHTDSDLPRKSRARFPTNWHLSSARALAVLQCLAEEGGIDEDNLALVAWAANRPLVENTSAANKRKNRRVEIYALSGESSRPRERSRPPYYPSSYERDDPYGDSPPFNR